MMEQEKITVLLVCSSGVSISSMLTRKIKDALAPLGKDVAVIHLVPTIVEGIIADKPVDFIVTTSPIPGTVNAPMINGMPLLSGFGADQVVETIINTARKALDRD